MQTSNQDLQAQIDFFSQFVTPARTEKIFSRLESRTRHLTVVLEDIYQPHNCSAALRSAECFGINDFHIIENRYDFTSNSEISKGSEQWLDISRYKQTEFNTPACFEKLKSEGYVIAAACLEQDAIPIDELDLSKKTALVFGTEKDGLSDYAIKNSDIRFIIPMLGFTQSLNISVSVSISLFYLRNKMKQCGINAEFSEEERSRTLLKWLIQSAPNGEMMQKAYLNGKLKGRP